MINIIKAESRGSADHGWLRAKHTFSFAEYHNPARIHFGPLRVINEDRIAPGRGFDTHPHKDMEIVTYPISGAIEHRDSIGNGTVISAGEVQRMTAGTGVQHSEFNHSRETELHLLQIWLFPEEKNLQPGYEQTAFLREDKLNQFRLIASRDGRAGSITIHQKVDLYASVLERGAELHRTIDPQHKVFIQVIDGELRINNQLLTAGDGLQMEKESELSASAQTDTEFLLFDMG